MYLTSASGLDHIQTSWQEASNSARDGRVDNDGEIGQDDLNMDRIPLMSVVVKLAHQSIVSGCFQ